MFDTISVIIPTYNRKKSLIQAIQSVLEQTHTTYEVIVVDDGSTDLTEAVIAEQFPEIKYHSQPHQGVSAARNLGISLAQGQWLAFLDSDDLWLAKKLELQVSYFKQHPEVKICHTEEIWIRHGVRVNPKRKHQKKGGWIFQECLPLCAMSPSSIIIHRSVIEEVGGFDEQLPACEDYDLWLRMTSRYPVGFIEQPLIQKFGGHSDQLSRQYWGMDRFRIQALIKILEINYLTENDRQGAVAMLLKKAQVYLQGAKKRSKLTEVAYYQQLIQRFSE